MRANACLHADQARKVADLARNQPERALTSLHHLIDLEWMFEAYRLTRKDGAPCIDGMTAAEYEANLEVNLAGLLTRIKPNIAAEVQTLWHDRSV